MTRPWNGLMRPRAGAVLLVLVAWVGAFLILTAFGRPTTPHCSSTQFAQRGDSTFYEVVCVGGALPRE